jgi:hypothetical protein
LINASCEVYWRSYVNYTLFQSWTVNAYNPLYIYFLDPVFIMKVFAAILLSSAVVSAAPHVFVRDDTNSTIGGTNSTIGGTAPITNGTDSTLDKITDKVSDAKDKLSEAKDKLEDGLTDKLDDAKDKLDDAKDKVSAALDSVLERVASWTIPSTCPWSIPWPLPDTPNPTVDDVAIPQLELFPRPQTTANTLTIYNFCDYDLWFEPHIGNTLEATGHIPAGGKLDRPFEMAPEGSGVNLKVTKTEGDYSKPVQVEYAVSAGTVWYDLSLIDCLGRTPEGLRNGDTSACAGHEAGLQMGPAANAVSFQCGAGAWCDDQMYLYEVSHVVPYRVVVS